MNLNQVTLPTTNVERCAEFYRRLGFTQIVSNLPRYARFECRDGGATFSLHHVESCKPSETIIYFECDTWMRCTRNCVHKVSCSTRRQRTNRGFGARHISKIPMGTSSVNITREPIGVSRLGESRAKSPWASSPFLQLALMAQNDRSVG